jgi:hypothetical protein
MNRLRGRVPRGWRLYLYVVAVNLSVIGSNRVELRHLYSYGGVRGPVTSIAWAFGRHLISQPRLLVTRQSLLSSVLSPHLTMCIWGADKTPAAYGSRTTDGFLTQPVDIG